MWRPPTLWQRLGLQKQATSRYPRGLPVVADFSSTDSRFAALEVCAEDILRNVDGEQGKLKKAISSDAEGVAPRRLSPNSLWYIRSARSVPPSQEWPLSDLERVAPLGLRGSGPSRTAREWPLSDREGVAPLGLRGSGPSRTATREWSGPSRTAREWPLSDCEGVAPLGLRGSGPSRTAREWPLSDREGVAPMSYHLREWSLCLIT